MPFATNKPDTGINPAGCEYPPFIVECGFTESYEAVLADAVAWLTQTSGIVRVVLLIKLTEIKTDLVPPPLSIDAWAEDDNSPKECNLDDPAYEHLRASTVTAEWVGPLEGFAEIWRPNATGGVKRDGDRITLLPRQSGGVRMITLSKADMFGPRARPGDKYTMWDLDLNEYLDVLVDATHQMAFQRRVRYLKATQGEGAGKNGDSTEAQVQA